MNRVPPTGPTLLQRETIELFQRFVNRDDVDFGLAHDLPPVQKIDMVQYSEGMEVSVCPHPP